MDITAIHQIFLTCTSVTTDSRNCPQGSLFIALKGESFNGNAFAARALESGSAYAIVDEEAYAPAGDTAESSLQARLLREYPEHSRNPALRECFPQCTQEHPDDSSASGFSLHFQIPSPPVNFHTQW